MRPFHSVDGEAPSRALAPLPHGPTHANPMALGFLYLVAVIDWATRAVLAWRLSNTMETGFCIAALDEALARHGTPKIFGTDQGAQFTSAARTGTRGHGHRDFDGRTRSLDGTYFHPTLVALDQI
jgi:transposase InsO family protein